MIAGFGMLHWRLASWFGLRDHSATGRHKIQDLWGPVVYRTIRGTTREGDETKVGQVHYTLLKVMAGTGPQTGATPYSPPRNQLLLEGELSCDGDLLVLVVPVQLQ